MPTNNSRPTGEQLKGKQLENQKHPSVSTDRPLTVRVIPDSDTPQGSPWPHFLEPKGLFSTGFQAIDANEGPDKSHLYPALPPFIIITPILGKEQPLSTDDLAQIPIRIMPGSLNSKAVPNKALPDENKVTVTSSEWPAIMQPLNPSFTTMVYSEAAKQALEYAHRIEIDPQKWEKTITRVTKQELKKFYEEAIPLYVLKTIIQATLEQLDPQSLTNEQRMQIQKMLQQLENGLETVARAYIRARDKRIKALMQPLQVKQPGKGPEESAVTDNHKESMFAKRLPRTVYALLPAMAGLGFATTSTAHSLEPANSKPITSHKWEVPANLTQLNNTPPTPAHSHQVFKTTPSGASDIDKTPKGINITLQPAEIQELVQMGVAQLGNRLQEIFSQLKIDPQPILETMAILAIAAGVLRKDSIQSLIHRINSGKSLAVLLSSLIILLAACSYSTTGSKIDSNKTAPVAVNSEHSGQYNPLETNLQKVPSITTLDNAFYGEQSKIPGFAESAIVGHIPQGGNLITTAKQLMLAYYKANLATPGRQVTYADGRTKIPLQDATGFLDNEIRKILPWSISTIGHFKADQTVGVFIEHGPQDTMDTPFKFLTDIGYVAWPNDPVSITHQNDLKATIKMLENANPDYILTIKNQIGGDGIIPGSIVVEIRRPNGNDSITLYFEIYDNGTWLVRRYDGQFQDGQGAIEKLKNSIDLYATFKDIYENLPHN